MATNYKSLALAGELVSELKIRFPGKVVTQSFDSDGNPTITVNDGSPAAGEQNFFVKLMPISWPLAKDVFGNAANIYVPDVIQLATEETAASATVTLITAANMLQMLGALITKGCQVQWYTSDNGTAPTAATLVAANLKGTFDPDMYQPLAGQ